MFSLDNIVMEWFDDLGKGEKYSFAGFIQIFLKEWDPNYEYSLMGQFFPSNEPPLHHISNLEEEVDEEYMSNASPIE